MMKQDGVTIWVQSLSNIFTNDKGFFQGGKSFGGRGLLGDNGVLSGLGDKLGGLRNALKPKPYAGIPGVCPYTGKPLNKPENQQKCQAIAASNGEEPPPEALGNSLSDLRRNSLAGAKTMPLGNGYVDTSSPFIRQQMSIMGAY